MPSGKCRVVSVSGRHDDDRWRNAPGDFRKASEAFYNFPSLPIVTDILRKLPKCITYTPVALNFAVKESTVHVHVMLWAFTNCIFPCTVKSRYSKLMGLFLAHLAQSAKVRYWGGPVSIVVCRVSCVVRRQQLHKHLLLRNYWAESYETSPEASLGEEKQTIQNGILIPSLFWFPWQPKEKS